MPRSDAYSATTPTGNGDSSPVYYASRSDTALRIEDLMREAAALRSQRDFSKAMELYNEALALAPRYAEGYRQRALTLVRLGDRVQAQVDYNRFLALDPQAPERVHAELALWEQSGRSPIGNSQAAAANYGTPLPADAGRDLTEIRSSPRELADARFLWAQGAFQSGRYDTALQWATSSDRDMPRARTRALISQILFAQGDFRGAAAQARGAVAMGPAIDWRVLYSDYGSAISWFSRQLDALKEFVRQNPSSADGHFLLGYQYLIQGEDKRAHAELAIAAVIEPDDVVAKDLLARDGVEIVSSHRPLAQSESPRGDVSVAGREPEPSNGVTPPPLPPSHIPPTSRQAQRPTDLR